MTLPNRTYSFEQKWGDDPFTALGYTQVPNALIEYAVRLGLDLDECWLITVILNFKHTPADPFPKQMTLAELLGLDRTNVNRKLAAIAAKGYLKIKTGERAGHGHFAHTVYDFVPLRKALNTCYYQDHPQEKPKGFKPVALYAPPSKNKQQPRGAIKKRTENAVQSRNADGVANPHSDHAATLQQHHAANPQQDGVASLQSTVMQTCDSNRLSESEKGIENLNRASGDSILSSVKSPKIPDWATLSDIDKEPWRERAKEKLEEFMNGPDRNGVQSKAIDNSAKGLYQKAMKVRVDS